MSEEEPAPAGPAEGGLLVHGMGLDLVEPDWPPLTTAEAQEVLGRFAGLPGSEDATIVWRSPRPFGAAAIVELPPGAGDRPRRLVVKRHHRRVRDAAALEGEHAFIRHLASRGVPVPRLMETGGMQRCALETGDFAYEVQSVVAGVDQYRDALSWTPYLSERHASESGASLARLHLASEGFGGANRGPLPLLPSCEIVSSDDPIEAVARFAAARPALADYLAGRPWQEELGQWLLPAQRAVTAEVSKLEPLFVHGDWHPSNLLWSDDTLEASVSGIIDFGLSNRTSACHDLATAIERSGVDWLSPPAQRAIHDRQIAALIDGYESVRPLEPAERAALPLLLPVVHVEYALSEVDYFHGIVDSAANAALAYDDYLIGHLAWFASAEGRRLVDLVGTLVGS